MQLLSLQEQWRCDKVVMGMTGQGIITSCKHVLHATHETMHIYIIKETGFLRSFEAEPDRKYSVYHFPAYYTITSVRGCIGAYAKTGSR